MSNEFLRKYILGNTVAAAASAVVIVTVETWQLGSLQACGLSLPSAATVSEPHLSSVHPSAWAPWLWCRLLVALWHVGSSPTRDWTCVPCLAGRFLPTGPPGKSLRMIVLTKENILSWRININAAHGVTMPGWFDRERRVHASLC